MVTDDSTLWFLKNSKNVENIKKMGKYATIKHIFEKWIAKGKNDKKNPINYSKYQKLFPPLQSCKNHHILEKAGGGN